MKLGVYTIIIIVSIKLNECKIPRSFFGIHIHNHHPNISMISEPWKEDINFGSIRLWDSGTYWPALEPNKGEYVFDTLDAYVEMGMHYNVEIVLTLGITPSWAASKPDKLSPYGEGTSCSPPKDMNDWEAYVDTLGMRYDNQIMYWEIWNEPDIPIEPFYCGSIWDMVEMTRIAHNVLKNINPGNKIVSPSVTQYFPIWLLPYMLYGGRHYVDVIGFHFYYVPYIQPTFLLPYYNIPIIKIIRYIVGMDDVPIWYTEGGFPVCKKTSLDHCWEVPGNYIADDRWGELMKYFVEAA